MYSIKNYTLPAKTWTNLNTFSSIVVGTPMTVFNNGKTDVRVVQNDTIPLAANIGLILTTNNKNYAQLSVNGGDAIWIYPLHGDCEIAIQEGA